MTSRPLRTSDIAQRLGVHVNTIRLYETREFLSPVPRGQNGYRQYSALHLEQARLVDLALRWPYLGERALLVELVKSAARNELGTALELAYHYLAQVRTARVQAEVAVAYLEQWAASPVADALPHKLSVSQAAKYLNVTVDMLRNWERNGLLRFPATPPITTAAMGRSRWNGCGLFGCWSRPATASWLFYACSASLTPASVTTWGLRWNCPARTAPMKSLTLSPTTGFRACKTSNNERRPSFTSSVI
ncbi:MAG: MerR family DNA-binding transcriptional regulator [Anaerolineae bacterium]|nr:MerR family DNA-binding transcriptional regulator [Anaerolineae bacterium]